MPSYFIVIFHVGATISNNGWNVLNNRTTHPSISHGNFVCNQVTGRQKSRQGMPILLNAHTWHITHFYSLNEDPTCVVPCQVVDECAFRKFSVETDKLTLVTKHSVDFLAKIASLRSILTATNRHHWFSQRISNWPELVEKASGPRRFKIIFGAHSLNILFNIEFHSRHGHCHGTLFRMHSYAYKTQTHNDDGNGSFPSWWWLLHQETPST